MAITGTPSVLCLPPLEWCDSGGSNPTKNPTGNPYFIDCESKYNNTLCNLDKCYYMPYVAGDSIWIQDNSPSLVSTVNVTDLNGDPLSVPATVNQTLTATGQLIEVIVPSGNPCFKIELVSPRATKCVNMDFAFVDCEKTFKIKGIYEDGEQDCFGNIYPFDNTLRFRGYLVRGKEDTITKIPFGNTYAKAEVQSYWTLIISDMVPAYVHDLLSKMYFSANSIQITDENGDTFEFITEDSFTLASQPLSNRMFHYGESIKLKMVCKVSRSC